MSDTPKVLPPPGSILAGKYRIEHSLGQGGMGVVLAAHHLQLDQRVALKLMLPHVSATADSVARFLREARAAARISNPHVARIYDVGSLETGEPFIAMEYLEGANLGDLLTRRGALPPEEAVSYLRQACEGLAEAHAVGVIHRDLKPENLFLARRRDGSAGIKVLDFGISKIVESAASPGRTSTKTSALMGTPLYMSPEQMSSANDVDARSDVWALGVVLYEMLTGTPPFKGETLPQVCAMVMGRAPVPLSELVPSLPKDLVAVVNRCLEKEPAARYQTIAQLARALGYPAATPAPPESPERSAAGPVEIGGGTLVDLPLMGGSAATYSPVSGTRPPVRRKRSGLPLALGASAIALAAVALWLRSSGESSASAPPRPDRLAESATRSAVMPSGARVGAPTPTPPTVPAELPMGNSAQAPPPPAVGEQVRPGPSGKETRKPLPVASAVARVGGVPLAPSAVATPPSPSRLTPTPPPSTGSAPLSPLTKPPRSRL